MTSRESFQIPITHGINLLIDWISFDFYFDDPKLRFLLLAFLDFIPVIKFKLS